MRQTLWHRLDVTARHQIPLLTAVVLLVLAVVLPHVIGLTRIGPNLTLVAVYYWAIYRPDLLGYGSAFGIGVAQDLLAGTPPGVGALVFLLTHAAVVGQHRFFNARPFVVTWWAFGLVAAGAFIINWLGVSLVQGVLVDGKAAFYGYLMTVAVYPVVGWVLARLQIALLRDV